MSVIAETSGSSVARPSLAGWGRRLAILPWLVLTIPLTLYPIGLLVFGSFSTVPPQEMSFRFSELTLQNYALLFNPFFRAALGTSIVCSAGGAAAAVVVGLVFAWLVAKTDFRFRRAVEISVLVPFFVSPLMGAIAWSVLASPYSGLINLFLQEVGIDFRFDIQTIWGVIFIFGLYYTPYAYLMIKPALSRIDGSLEEAALISGSTTARTLRSIVLPLIQRSLLSSFLLIFASLMSIYAIPLVIGDPGHMVFMTTYLRRLLLEAPADYQRAAVLAVVMIAFTFGALGVQSAIVGRRRVTTVTGKGHRTHQTRLGKFTWIAAVVVVLYLLLAIVLPYFAIFQASFRKFIFFTSVVDLFTARNFTFDHMIDVWADRLLRRSVLNSLFVGVMVALGGTLFCFLLAYVIQKTRVPGRSFLEFLATMPIAVPSLVIGVAFLWAWIGAPFGLYGSIWIIILAYIARHLPDGVQGMSNSLVQIDSQLEEAATICGSRQVRTLRTIVLPLVRPGAYSIAVLLFIMAVREIGPSLFLYNSSTIVMAVQVLNNWEVGNLGGAAALSLVQSLIITLVILLSRWIFKVEVGRH